MAAIKSSRSHIQTCPHGQSSDKGLEQRLHGLLVWCVMGCGVENRLAQPCSKPPFRFSPLHSGQRLLSSDLDCLRGPCPLVSFTHTTNNYLPYHCPIITVVGLKREGVDNPNPTFAFTYRPPTIITSHSATDIRSLSHSHSLYTLPTSSTPNQLYAHATPTTTETQHPAPALLDIALRPIDKERDALPLLLQHYSTATLHYLPTSSFTVSPLARWLAPTIASPTWPLPTTSLPAQSTSDQRSNAHCELSSSAASLVPKRALLARRVARMRSARLSPPTAMHALPWSACATRVPRPQVPVPTLAQ